MKMVLGDRIKALREKREWSQTLLSKKLGISKSVMSRIEAGTRPLEDSLLTKLADILEVSADYLLGRKSNVLVMKSEVDKDRESAYAAIDRLHGSKLQLAKNLLEELSKEGKP